ncbi:hypothetical protein C8_59 [Cannes 8 virus]|nr:hypothetical protein C8_59 [Cannes 8 virus]
MKRISHCYFFFRTKRILFSRLSKFKRELRGQNMETTGLFIWVGGRLTYTIINTAPGLSEYIKKSLWRNKKRYILMERQKQRMPKTFEKKFSYGRIRHFVRLV